MVMEQDCSCTESGNCSCEPLECFCDCGCEECLIELDECPCGGNCGCSEEGEILPNTDSFKDIE